MKTTASKLISLFFLCSVTISTNSEINLALAKPATASSTLRTPGAGNDGSPSTNWYEGSCFAVKTTDHNPWWQVDLQAIVFVLKVTVSSRGDESPERLHDFAIDVYDTNPSTNPQSRAKRCYFYQGAVTSPGVTVTINCTRPVIGRILRISGKNKLNTDDQFQFCELQVFGEIGKHVPFESCSAFTLYPGRRLSATAIETRPNSTRANCAAQCEGDMSCVGFNMQYSPEVTCQLVQDPDVVAPVVDAFWDSYLLNQCWERC